MAQTNAEKVKTFKFWTWITADEKRTDASFSEEFEKYSKNGIDAVLINTYANPELLRRLVPFAKAHNLEVHAWMFTVNRQVTRLQNSIRNGTRLVVMENPVMMIRHTLDIINGCVQHVKHPKDIF